MDGPLLISLGSVNVDFQVRTDRWPEPGETLLAGDFLVAGGGKAANVAFLARRLERRARLVASVGEDVLAGLALDPLEQAGVELDRVRRLAGGQTGASLIDVRPDGEKAILLAANANDDWGDDGIGQAAAAVREASAGSVLAADLEVPVEVVRAAMRSARDAGRPVVLDPSPAGRADDELLALADCVTPNRAEAETLTGVAVTSPADGVTAGRRLLERGAGAALVKLGSEGCVLVMAHSCLHARAEPREAVDATGAGDAFTGALAVALLDGRAIEQALPFAVATSALAVQSYGSQAAYPAREEVERAAERVTISSPRED